MKKTTLLLVSILTLVAFTGCEVVQQQGEAPRLNTDGGGATVSLDESVTTTTTAAPTPAQTEQTGQIPATSGTSSAARSTASTATATSADSVATTSSAAQVECVSAEEAKRVALDKAGVSEKAVSRYEAELDYDDDARRWEYEIGFYVGTTEYDLEIDAETGKVICFEKEVDETKLTKETSKTATTTTSTTRKTDKISKQEAKNIALKKAGVSADAISRYEIELDYDDDARRWEYEIGFYVGTTEYDLGIDATTGKVVAFEKDVERTKKTAQTTAATTKATVKLSKAEVKTLVLKKAGVSADAISRYEIELDYDDDAKRWEYEVSFRVGKVEYDLVIDANTGKILEFEKDAD